jgi:hypothetical protein
MPSSTFSSAVKPGAGGASERCSRCAARGRCRARPRSAAPDPPLRRRASKRILPESGVRMPAIRCSSVVLPDPLEPTSATCSPSPAKNARCRPQDDAPVRADVALLKLGQSDGHQTSVLRAAAGLVSSLTPSSGTPGESGQGRGARGAWSKSPVRLSNREFRRIKRCATSGAARPSPLPSPRKQTRGEGVCSSTFGADDDVVTPLLSHHLLHRPIDRLCPALVPLLREVQVIRHDLF